MTFNPDPERDIRIESKYDAWREKAEFDFDLDVLYRYIAEQVQEAIEGRSAESARAASYDCTMDLAGRDGSVTTADLADHAKAYAREVDAAGRQQPTTDTYL